MPLLTLPNELLLHISTYLPSPTDLNNLLRSSSHLSQLLTPSLHQHAILDKDHMPALHWSIQRDHTPLTLLVLARGPDPIDYQNQTGWTALHHAVSGGRLETVLLLLERNANINIEDDLGETALIKAVRNASEEEHNVHSRENVWIHADDQRQPRFAWAGLETHIAIIRLLLAKGASVTATSNSGQTPLHWAIRAGSETLVRMFLEGGADVRAADSRGQTPFHWACRYGTEPSIISMLLERGVDVCARGELGNTPLHWAVMGIPSAVWLVKLLLEMGTEVDAYDILDGTPLHCAVAYGDSDVIRLLLENGADVDAPLRHGETALHIAVFRGREEAVGLLLEFGADMYAVDAAGKMPWEYIGEMEPSRKEERIVLLFSKRLAMEVRFENSRDEKARRLTEFILGCFRATCKGDRECLKLSAHQ